MIKLSTGAIKSILITGNTEFLEECHQKFISGDRAALMEALFSCSMFHTLLPDWLADEMLNIDTRLNDNHEYDLNKFFGFVPDKKPKFKFDKNVRENEKVAVSALFNHRLDGGNFNDDESLRPIAKELKISERELKEIYNKNKEWLKKTPQNREVNHGFAIIEIPIVKLLVEHIRKNRNK